MEGTRARSKALGKDESEKQMQTAAKGIENGSKRKQPARTVASWGRIILDLAGSKIREGWIKNRFARKKHRRRARDRWFLGGDFVCPRWRGPRLDMQCMWHRLLHGLAGRRHMAFLKRDSAAVSFVRAMEAALACTG